MAEILRAKVIYGTSDVGQIIEITEPEPLESAVTFKGLSDFILSQEPTRGVLRNHFIESEGDFKETITTLNDILGEVDEELIIFGTGKALNLGKVYGQGQPIVIDAETMNLPTAVGVEAFNDDRGNNFRQQFIGDEVKGIEILDGHVDYSRELGIKLRIGKKAMATYYMQRAQSYQADTTSVNLRLSHSDFMVDFGHTHELGEAELSEQHEIQILDLIKKIIEK